MLLTKNGRIKNLALMIMLAIICSVITVAAYHVYFLQKTVVLDIGAYIASQKEGYLTGNISAGELVENIDALVAEINAAKRNKVYILNTPAAGVAKQNHPVQAGEDDEDGEKP
jgi:hypothetical protein